MHPKSDFNTILVVADEPAKAARLTPVLAAEGYQIETVLSLSLPLPKLNVKPDLGIIWFPYSSPDALPKLEKIIQAIQGLGQTDPLPVLLIIDQDGTRWVEPSFRLGITDILTRPIHPLILRQRVRLILKARQTEELINQLTRKVESQERQRMINALDSALQMFRTGSPAVNTRADEVIKTTTPMSIHPQLNFDPEQHCLLFNVNSLSDCRKIELTADQSSILLYMVCHPYRALSNREIAQAALGYKHLDEIQARSIVRPHILRLRRKLETDSGQPAILRTIRGAGYLFSPD
jgi:two-component system, OmpR family, alkaline phosphatase synthesis response regulator PhoP